MRTNARQRLEFEYSTALSSQIWRLDVETILQSAFQQIGIKLDIQNYPPPIFIGSFLPKGSASPPTGAVAGRYDIAEYAQNFYYDPDDAQILACDQFPPVGSNYDYYCNHDLDALYKQEQATADPGIRQRIFVQIHNIYLTQFPFIVLSGLLQIVMAKKHTHNFQPGPFSTDSNIWEWWCDQGKC